MRPSVMSRRSLQPRRPAPGGLCYSVSADTPTAGGRIRRRCCCCAWEEEENRGGAVAAASDSLELHQLSKKTNKVFPYLPSIDILRFHK